MSKDEDVLKTFVTRVRRMTKRVELLTAISHQCEPGELVYVNVWSRNRSSAPPLSDYEVELPVESIVRALRQVIAADACILDLDADETAEAMINVDPDVDLGEP